MSEPVKRIYRSRDDAVLFGVCGGLGAYLSLDPVLIRLIWIVVTVFTGFLPGILTYLGAAVIVPAERRREPATSGGGEFDRTPVSPGPVHAD